MEESPFNAHHMLSYFCCSQLCHLIHRFGEHAHFVFVLQFRRGWNVTSPPESGKVFALRAWLGAGVNTAEFQEVFILDDVFMWQVVEDSCFIQVFTALCDWTFYICLSQLHLHVNRRVKNYQVSGHIAVKQVLHIYYAKSKALPTHLVNCTR